MRINTADMFKDLGKTQEYIGCPKRYSCNLDFLIMSRNRDHCKFHSTVLYWMDLKEHDTQFANTFPSPSFSPILIYFENPILNVTNKCQCEKNMATAQCTYQKALGDTSIASGGYGYIKEKTEPFSFQYAQRIKQISICYIIG